MTVDQQFRPRAAQQRSRRWMIAIGCIVVILLVGSVWVFHVAGDAVPQSEQRQIHQAITADIDYRNAQMITPIVGASQGTPFPTMVTAAQKAALMNLPSRAANSDRFIGFRTTISVTSLNLKGQVTWAEFTETTLMPRPKPLPEYGYSTPQVAELKKVHGVWMVDSIHFAPESGMDGATCSPHRWAGDC